MSVRFSKLADVQRLIDSQIPESTSLEFKSKLDLATRDQKREALKDLSGMANGGGGVVVFGLAETEGGIADSIEPLTDRTLLGILEDIVQVGVRPPLLWDYESLEHLDGYVLVVDVQPSPLGPYMVELHGEQRYFYRSGMRGLRRWRNSRFAMRTLAHRSRDRRPDLWTSQALPIQPPSEESWLSLSVLPEEPLGELLDLTSIDPGRLQPDPPIDRYVRTFGLWEAMSEMSRWADGLFGQDGSGGAPSTIVRLHTNGAIGITRKVLPQLYALSIARMLNTQLLVAAWFWREFGLSRPVEIRMRLDNLTGTSLDIAHIFGQQQMVREPPGVPVHSIEIADLVMPWDVLRAAHRHRLVRRFVNRLYNAFGQAESFIFHGGQLLGQDGLPTGFSVLGAAVWNDRGEPAAMLYDDGTVRRTSTDVIGSLDRGSYLTPLAMQ